MWQGMLWFALLTAAMLCYPRRPRTAGVLWITLGVLSLFLRYLHNPGSVLGAISAGAFFVGLGVIISSSIASRTFGQSTSNMDREGLSTWIWFRCLCLFCSHWQSFYSWSGRSLDRLSRSSHRDCNSQELSHLGSNDWGSLALRSGVFESRRFPNPAPRLLTG